MLNFILKKTHSTIYHMHLTTHLRILFSLIGFLVLSSHISYGQEEIERQDNFLAVGINYGIDFPAGDLADRFGQNFHAAISLDLYSIKMKGFLGLESNFQFGNKVKEDVLAPLRISNGAVLGNDGAPATLFLRRRGIYVGIYANKTVLPFKHNNLSGLTLGLGVGILQHNLRILNDTNNAGQLNGDYLKGYDRSTRGPALKQTLTYQRIGNNRSMNFSLGLSITEAFTNSVRAINFDTGLAGDTGRLDILIGLEAKWYLPVKSYGAPQEIFY